MNDRVHFGFNKGRKHMTLLLYTLDGCMDQNTAVLGRERDESPGGEVRSQREEIKECYELSGERLRSHFPIGAMYISHLLENGNQQECQ